MEFLLNLDVGVILFFDKINDIPLVSFIVKFITTLGNGGIIWIALGLYLVLFDKKRREIGISLLLSICLGAIIGNVFLKPIFARPRPYESLGLDIIIDKPGGFSFPSGHTTAGFASASGVWGYNRVFGAVLYVFAAIMGLSRIYLLVHYPSDVLAGAALGIFSGFLARKIIKGIG